MISYLALLSVIFGVMAQQSMAVKGLNKAQLQIANTKSHRCDSLRLISHVPLLLLFKMMATIVMTMTITMTTIVLAVD